MTPKNDRPIKIIAGNSNPDLAKKIAEYMRIPISPSLITTFSDGECQIEIHDNMRGCDVFVIQSTCNPVNDNLMELYFILDALKRSDCWRVTAVIPYFGYARQDRKIKSRVPISAKAVANLLHAGNIDRILTIDLHSGQIQGFFECPVDNLFGSKVFIKHIKENLRDKEYTVLLSPDTGGTDRVLEYSKALDISMATTYKKRGGPNEIEKMIILGVVKGQHVILIDDMIDTAGTTCKVAELAIAEGAKSVTVYATHPVFSGPAAERLAESPISKIYVTDTIPLNPQLDCNNFECITRKVEQVSVAPFFANAIMNIHNETSVSCLLLNE